MSDDYEECPACSGSGLGPCAICGDDCQGCACDEPDHADCDQCNGTGHIDEDDDA